MNPTAETEIAPIRERMAKLGGRTSEDKRRSSKQNGELGGAHTEGVETILNKRAAWVRRRQTVGYSKSGRKQMSPEGSANVAAANRRRAEARRQAANAPQ